MKGLEFDLNGWEDYLYWQNNNKTILKKINSLVKETIRTPFSGTGKPEALKGDLSGFWSRRINGEHRLVYAVSDDRIIISQCRYHYQK